MEKLNAARRPARRLWRARRPTGCRAFPGSGSAIRSRIFTTTRARLSTSARTPQTGVTKLEVAAFDARSAEAIAAAMLDLAERHGQQPQRPRAGRHGRRPPSGSSTRRATTSSKCRAELTAFRNESLLVDPLAFAGAMLQEIGSLSLERARTQAQIAEAERLSPNSPGARLAESLRRRARAQGRRGARQARRRQFGARRQSRQLRAPHAAARTRGEALRRRARLAANRRSEAQRKRVYIEEIVAPNLPDEPTRPERLRSISLGLRRRLHRLLDPVDSQRRVEGPRAMTSRRNR